MAVNIKLPQGLVNQAKQYAQIESLGTREHGARSRIENIADELSATGTRSCNSQYLFAF